MKTIKIICNKFEQIAKFENRVVEVVIIKPLGVNDNNTDYAVYRRSYRHEWRFVHAYGTIQEAEHKLLDICTDLLQ